MECEGEPTSSKPAWGPGVGPFPLRRRIMTTISREHGPRGVALDVQASDVFEEVVAAEAFVARKRILAQVEEVAVGAGLAQMRWRIERGMRLLEKPFKGTRSCRGGTC